jgi:hypothetical protein
MFALPPALLIGLSGLWLVKLRGPRPGAPEPVAAATAVPRSRDVILPGIAMSRDQLFATLAAATSAAATSAASPTSAASATDPIVRLEKLQALLDAGALSPDEFQQAKAKILAEM